MDTTGYNCSTTVKPETSKPTSQPLHRKTTPRGPLIPTSSAEQTFIQCQGKFGPNFFQWQMTKSSEKSADNQSEARISVAITKTVSCHWWQVLWSAPLIGRESNGVGQVEWLYMERIRALFHAWDLLSITNAKFLWQISSQPIRWHDFSSF